MNPAYTLYSDNSFAHAADNALRTQRQAGFHLLDQFRANPPGVWLDNKYEESQHHRGVPFVAINAIMDVLHCASVTVGRRKRSKNKSTLPAGDKLTKSIATQQQGSSANEDYEPVSDHPICRLIQQPNPNDTFGQILSYLALQNRLTGVGPLWTVPNEDGKPVELYALPTALTTPQWQKTPEFPHGAWRVQPFYASGGLGYLPGPFSGTGVIVPNDEIKRFMEPHPLFRWDGKSPLSAGAFQLDVLEEIDQARWAAFDHGVTMDAVLQVDGFDEPQIARLEAKMEAKHQGARNHRRFLILSGQLGTEKTRLNSFSQSPKEMDFNASWEQMVGFVLAIFGVPKSVAGLSMASSYSELYAALRQFYQRQKAFAFRLAEFLTKAIAWPYCKFPGEYRVQVELPTLDDPDLQEKQLGLDCQYDTVLYNEVRKLRNRPPVPGGDVPVSIYVAMKTQEFAPEPQPAMPGMEGMAVGAEGDPNASGQQEGPPDEQTVMDDVTREALQKIGEEHGVNLLEDEEEQPQNGQPVTKARAAPKFKPKKSGVFSDKRGRRYRLENGKRVMLGEAKPTTQRQPGQQAKPGDVAGGRNPAAVASQLLGQQSGVEGTPTQQPQAKPQPGVHDRASRPGFKSAAAHATATPEGKAIIARAKEWAGRQADKHADRIAAHLGISRMSAHFLLRTTIEQLCREALATGEGASKTHENKHGKLTIGIRRKQPGGGGGKGPTSGATPHPENKQAFGSRPPLAPKAMSAYQSGHGAELVMPAGCGKVVGLKRPKRKRRRVSYLDKLMKGLPC